MTTPGCCGPSHSIPCVCACVQWAMYCLMLFYYSLHDELHALKPMGKLLCIKGVLFFTFWSARLPCRELLPLSRSHALLRLCAGPPVLSVCAGKR